MRWSTRLLRTARKLDDLAEVLICRLLLGTRTGRRVAAVGMIGLVAVLSPFSGTMFNPVSPVIDERGSCAPYLGEHTWMEPSAELLEMGTSGVVLSQHRVAIEAELAAYQTALDRIVHLTEGPQFVRFEGTPNFKFVRQAASVLIARGVWRLNRGHAPEAGQDWIAAARFGRAAGYGRGEGKLVLEAMMTTHIERRAYQALLRGLQTRPSIALANAVDRDWVRRTRGGELKLVAKIPDAECRLAYQQLTQLARGEPTTLDAPGIRRMMPLRAQDRERFVNEVVEAMARTYAKMFDGWWKNPERSHEPIHRELCDSCATKDEFGLTEFSGTHRAKCLVSRDAAVRHLALKLVPRMEPVFKRLLERDSVIRDCLKLAETIHAEDLNLEDI